MILDNEQDIAQIDKRIESGNAVVEGRCTLGGMWPDEPLAWIVTDYVDMRTVHVRESDRPDYGVRR